MAEITQPATQRRFGEEFELLITLFRGVIEAKDLLSACSATLQIICDFAGWNLGLAWIPSAGEKELTLLTGWHRGNPELAEFVRICQVRSFSPDVGMPGRVWARRKSEWTFNLAAEPSDLFPLAPYAAQAGIKAALGVPVLDGEKVLAVLLFYLLEFRSKDSGLVQVVSEVATQLGFALRHKHIEVELDSNQTNLRQAHKEIETRLRERVRQQAGVAQLGERALGGVELLTLMDEATVIVAQALGVEFCKILELLPDGKALLLRAGVGWKEGLVGQTTVSAGTNSQAGYTLLSNEPVIIKDLRTEERFSGPPLLHDHGVVSGMSVIIRGQDGPFGVLGVHTRRPRVFNGDDVHFLESIANVICQALIRGLGEQTLRESEAQLRRAFEFNQAIVENMSEGLYTVDQQGLVTYINPAAERIFGWSSAELIGRKMHDTTHYKHSDGTPFPADECPGLQVLRDGKVLVNCEDTFIRKDGTFFEVLYSSSSIRLDNRLAGLAVVFRDMTAQKESETEIRRQTNWLGRLIETSQDAVISIDRQARIVLFNPGAERIFGYTQAEIQGQKVNVLMAEPYAKEHDSYLERYERTGEARAIGRIRTVEARRKNGATFPIELSITKVATDESDEVQYAAFIRDISEVRRGRAWLQSLIETTQDAVLSIDRQGSVVLFNPAAERIFGYTRNEIVGQKVNLLMAEPYATEHDGYIEHYERTGEARAIGRIRTVTARRKNGEAFPIELSVTKIAEDQEVQYAAFIRDITEKARLQAQAVENERLVAIGTTAAKIGHELANPLNGMSLTIQLLERRLSKQSNLVDTQLTSTVNRLRNEVARLSTLLEQFRSLSRREKFDFRRTTVTALVDEAIEIELPRYAELGIQVECSFPSNLPIITVDIDKMKQVIFNLIKNAVEAMAGGGRISIKGSTADDRVVLEISDTGTGIPADINIFEPFFTTKPQGTGLGLSIAQQIVTAHGGSITYSSEHGKGTTFLIALPRK